MQVDTSTLFWFILTFIITWQIFRGACLKYLTILKARQSHIDKQNHSIKTLEKMINSLENDIANTQEKLEKEFIQNKQKLTMAWDQKLHFELERATKAFTVSCKQLEAEHHMFLQQKPKRYDTSI